MSVRDRARWVRGLRSRPVGRVRLACLLARAGLRGLRVLGEEGDHSAGTTTGRKSG
jgi:hypothetical protein